MRSFVELPVDYSVGMLGEIKAMDRHEDAHWHYAKAPTAKEYYSSNVSAAPFPYAC